MAAVEQTARRLRDAINPWYAPICGLDIAALRQIVLLETPHLTHYTNQDVYWDSLRKLVLEEIREEITGSLEKVSRHSSDAQFSRISMAPNQGTWSVTSINVHRRTNSMKKNLVTGQYLVLITSDSRPHGLLGVANVSPNKQIKLQRVFDEMGVLPNDQTEFAFDCQLHLLVSLTSYERTYYALSEESKPSYFAHLIAADASYFQLQNPLATSCAEIEAVNPNLDMHQRRAAAAFIERDEGIQLLWGPPGTGKSTTITTILRATLRAGKRAVVSAHSNQAIGVLLDRLTKADPYAAVVTLSSADQTKLIYHLRCWGENNAALLTSLLHRLTELAAALTESDTQVLREEIQQTLQMLHCATTRIQTYVDELKETLALFTETPEHFYDDAHADELVSFIEIICEATSLHLSSVQAVKEKILLSKSIAVFSTLNALGRLKLGKPFTKKAMGEVDVAIVDEAGQTSEADIQTVFAINHNAMLLVGDPKQLPPTIKSGLAKSLGFEKSLMARLMDAGFPASMLQTNYRMLPRICRMPNRLFYADKLMNARYLAKRESPAKHLFSPYYQIVNVEGAEVRDPVTKSYYNETEATAVLSLYSYALSQGISAEDIWIITPYRAQMGKIREFAARGGVDVERSLATFDSAQGGEREFVILSLVRANHIKSYRFLESDQRINVAFTRARSALLALCNAATFDPLRQTTAVQQRMFDTLTLLSKSSEHYRTFLPLIDSQYCQTAYVDFPSLDEYLTNYGHYEDIPRDYGAVRAFYHFFGDELLTGQSPIIGDTFSLFRHPKLPVRTLGLQLLLDKFTHCCNINFTGLSHIFKPIVYDYPDYTYGYDGHEYHTAWEQKILLVFRGHDFTGAILDGLDLSECKFINVCFDGASLCGTRISERNMDLASLASYQAAQVQQGGMQAVDAAGMTSAVSTIILDAQMRGNLVDFESMAMAVSFTGQ